MLRASLLQITGIRMMKSHWRHRYRVASRMLAGLGIALLAGCAFSWYQHMVTADELGLAAEVRVTDLALGATGIGCLVAAAVVRALRERRARRPAPRLVREDPEVPHGTITRGDEVAGAGMSRASGAS